ncbi:hypothetical protein KTO58_03700 [Chitinophaga pendula]|uniref:hypothetical protein n=1 Tax=Chitinophaga TaxID=79328 RepID=UPI000BAF8745|nr:MULTISPECIES: hypothetical protein [Chitinophaga]ASZ14067.1 hypothetical protein CK934_25510 [Chitinophaga sp. MD30]UCJ08302.1 hypothetical protein KTO58_03700 [Chitinophaga pendula]
MYLSKEIFRDPHSSTTRELFYNEKKQIIAVLDLFKNEDNESGTLNIYEYTGESYRILAFHSDTNSYKTFLKHKHAVFNLKNWHAIEEVMSTREFTYENGQLVADHYHHHVYKSKESLTYTYQNGLKISETRVKDDGTVLKSVFTYQDGMLHTAINLANDQFIDMIIYVYGQHKLLVEEQIMRKYQNIQYLALQKKFTRNSQEEIEKTEYFGRYDNGMALYRIEEIIRKGNTLTKRDAFVGNADFAVGHYDLAALHNKLREDNMDWGIDIYKKDYFQVTGFEKSPYAVETYDQQQQLVKVDIIHPDTHQVHSRIVFRNEYNEASLPEFIIRYNVTNGKMEELDIKKFYYCD